MSNDTVDDVHIGQSYKQTVVEVLYDRMNHMHLDAGHKP